MSHRPCIASSTFWRKTNSLPSVQQTLFGITDPTMHYCSQCRYQHDPTLHLRFLRLASGKPESIILGLLKYFVNPTPANMWDLSQLCPRTLPMAVVFDSPAQKVVLQ